MVILVFIMFGDLFYQGICVRISNRPIVTMVSPREEGAGESGKSAKGFREKGSVKGAKGKGDLWSKGKGKSYKGSPQEKGDTSKGKAGFKDGKGKSVKSSPAES